MEEAKMCKAVMMFPGPDTGANDSVSRAIEPLRGRQVTIEYVGGCGILAERFQQPFIATDEGERYFGVDAIERFVAQQLRAG